MCCRLGHLAMATAAFVQLGFVFARNLQPQIWAGVAVSNIWRSRLRPLCNLGSFSQKTGSTIGAVLPSRTSRDVDCGACATWLRFRKTGKPFAVAQKLRVGLAEAELCCSPCQTAPTPLAVL